MSRIDFMCVSILSSAGESVEQHLYLSAFQLVCLTHRRGHSFQYLLNLFATVWSSCSTIDLVLFKLKAIDWCLTHRMLKIKD
jgi:hypothetical protein